jgi:hypothetical protein
MIVIPGRLGCHQFATGFAFSLSLDQAGRDLTLESQDVKDQWLMEAASNSLDAISSPLALLF